MVIKNKLTGITRFWMIKYYQKYFNVTTDEIKRRVINAVTPFNRTPIFPTGKPDLYGPMWIYFWNIILIMMCGYFSHYVEFIYFKTHKSNEEVQALIVKKLGKVWSLMTFYILMIPIGLYAVFGILGTGNPGFQRMLAIYGYSFTIFIPCYVIMIVPFEIIKYASLGCSAFISLYFISKELVEAGTKFLEDKTVKLVAIIWAALHIGFWILLKFYLFD